MKEEHMVGFIWGVVFGIMSFAGGSTWWHSHRANQAYECAMKSDRTDWGIESCYLKYDVVFPGYFEVK